MTKIEKLLIYDFSNSKNGRQSSYEGTWDTAYREDDIITHILRCEFGSEWSCVQHHNTWTIYNGVYDSCVLEYSHEDVDTGRRNLSIKMLDDTNLNINIITLASILINYACYKKEYKYMDSSEISKYKSYLYAIDAKKEQELQEDIDIIRRRIYCRNLTAIFFDEDFLFLHIHNNEAQLLVTRSELMYNCTSEYTLYSYKNGVVKGDPNNQYYERFLLAVDRMLLDKMIFMPVISQE